MPNLFILAGPNGAGKTTFYNFTAKKEFIPNELPFLNIDIITRQLGDYNETNFARAENIYRDQIATLLSNRQDFMIESNLAKESEYSWIQAMIKNGYEVTLYFLCTDYIEEVHVARVQKRVREGGHFVPSNIIEHRYKMALIYLRSNLNLFKKVYLIDNADTGTIKATTSFGLIETKSPDCPAWVQKVLFIAEKLQNKGL